MISKCTKLGCDNIFRHPQGVEQHYCSKFCRFLSAGARNRKRTAKIARLESTYINACTISEKLKEQKKKREDIKKEKRRLNG